MLANPASQNPSDNQHPNTPDPAHTPDEGGQAFPVPGHEGVHGPVFGMTLRDWFAGQALADLRHEAPEQHNNAQIALRCYRIADAMLAARKSGGAA